MYTLPPLPIQPPPQPSLWRDQAWIAGCVFAACLLGIFSRPLGYLSAFWPANALLVGLLLRHPLVARLPSTWLLCWLAFVGADLLTHSSWFVSLSLNSANLFGIGMAWWFLRRYPPDVLRFNRQRSVHVLLISGCIASVASAVGAWPASVAFQTPLWRTVLLWTTTELYNFILIVPLCMAAPPGWIWQWPRQLRSFTGHGVWPLVALLVCEALSLLIGGPGAIAFIMPAMVWCAMSYGVFRMAMINFAVCIFKTAAIAWGAFSFTPDHVMEVASYRVGLALLSLAPLAVACAYSLRLQTLQKLNHAVNHDFLTGVLARRALVERSGKLLSRLQFEGQPVAVLVMDLDHFKSVNDRYGHAQGDAVLQAFAALAQRLMRPEDLLGRMGGEEFAAVLPRTTQAQAMAIGQRLCDALSAQPIPLPDGTPLHVTMSVGLHAVERIAPGDSMDQLLDRADEALYQAKHLGRNQVRTYAGEVTTLAH